LGIDLHSAREQETGSLLVRYVVPDLALPEKMQQSLRGGSILPLISAQKTVTALLGGPPSSILAKQQRELLSAMTDALSQIKAEINWRLAFGLGCIPMILIGIGLGILQRGGHLLSAFGVSCLPAVVLIVAIVSGKNITRASGCQNSVGILITWSGLAFLFLLTLAIYRRLLRH
jgi:lipopolysaccharide export LptBFGC system permease protein LptF